MSVIGDAVAVLDPRPRGKRWTSLSYCVLDAVWSLNTRYDSVVVPLVRRVAAAFGDDQPTTVLETSGRSGAAADTAGALRRRRSATEGHERPDHFSAQRILRAEAALRYAQILVEYEVPSLVVAQALMAGPESNWKAVDHALAQVPGDGSYGIRRGYLWMLCGNDDLIKPDRIVLRWLSRFEPGIDPDRARQVVAEIAAELTARLRRPVTPWMIDHAIWLDERTR